MFAAARFKTPWVDDEFAGVISAARQWLRDNPCPDATLGQHFVGLLDAYAEMTSATVARVMQLRDVIVERVENLQRWSSSSSVLDELQQVGQEWWATKDEHRVKVSAEPRLR